MNCIVTAGPTYEPLDDVRRLTNFSTGRLGSELAHLLSARGHHVTLLIGQQATWRGERHALETQPFTTTQDLRLRLQALSTQPFGAVFHAAAVSDFAFGKIWERTTAGDLREVKAGKISSRSGTLLAELTPTPKIIFELRAWFPSAFLVGWKYETDGDRAEVIAKAEAQLTENRTDGCVANGRAYGSGFGLVTSKARHEHFHDTAALFNALESLAVGRLA